MISNIDEIKAAADIVDIIGSFVTLKQVGSSFKGKCPFHTDKNPSFSVLRKGLYKCFACDASGDSLKFLMEHEKMDYITAIKWVAARYHIQIEEDTKQYEKPVPRLEKISPKYIQYFEKRAISNNTLLRFNVTEAIEWMPKAAKETKALCFNYYKDSELVNIKFRARDKDFKLAKNAELVFYNLDSMQDQDYVVITEGEIDAMSVYEAGFYSVVSVPNGAAIGGLQLKYLDNCWKYFEGKTKIILATDNDEPGRLLQDELARRLGRERCFKINYPDGCKDANDILKTHGKLGLYEIIETAKPFPIEGVLTVDDLSDTLLDYYLNGYPEGYAAGIGEFDELLKFSGGQLTVITGSPGSGKSEFIDYISTSLARNHGWKFGVCSFENPAVIHASKLMEKFTGLSFNFRIDTTQRMDQNQFNEAILFTHKYFQFINISQADITIEGILNKCRELVLRSGIKGVIIDPWNYIEHKVPQGYTETQYISEALTLIKEFCVRTGVHVFLVAHPRKLMKDVKTKLYPVATMYDIAGSAHFFNKTDNGVSVHRDFFTGVVTVYVQKVRFSWLGKIGYASYSFDTFTRQYKQI